MKPKWRKAFYLEAKSYQEPDSWSEWNAETKVHYAHDATEAIRWLKRYIRARRPSDFESIFENYDFRAREA